MLAPMRPSPTIAICMSARLPRSRAVYGENSMNDLDRDLAGAARAHGAVIAALRLLTDHQVRQPSLLPGWTVGHVATHIARNADGHVSHARSGHPRRGRTHVSRRARAADRTTSRPGRGDPRQRSPATSRPRAAQLEAIWAAMPDAGLVRSGRVDRRRSGHAATCRSSVGERSRCIMPTSGLGYSVVGLGRRLRAAGARPADHVVGQSQADGSDRAAGSGHVGHASPSCCLAARPGTRSTASPPAGIMG